MICISVFAEDFEHAKRAVSTFDKGIDVVEIRIDNADSGIIERAVSEIERPQILTCRSASQGGLFEGTESERLTLLRQAMRFRPLYLDVEFGTAAEELMREQPRQPFILSFHDTEGTPQRLERIAASLLERKPAAMKLVPKVNVWDDNLRILETLGRLGTPDRNIILFGSGDKGIYSRMLAPAHGSAISYCSVDGAKPTAQGQLNVRNALEVLRLRKIKRSWKVYGIAGDPVSHSLSPAFHNTAFAKHGIDAVYLPFLVAKSEFEEFYKFACAAGIAGLSVTAPHKRAAAAHAEPGDQAAKSCGAANTLVRSDCCFKSFDTDGEAFIGMLRDQEGSVEGLRVFVLGAGGVARILGFAMRRAGATVALCSRDAEKGRAAAEQVGIKFTRDPIELASANVVINATSIGTSDEDSEGFIRGRLPIDALAVDLHYDPPETFFLRDAALRGCRTVNGLEMFIRQAALQFKLWTGIDRDLSELRKIPLLPLK